MTKFKWNFLVVDLGRDPFNMESIYANTNIANCPWSGSEDWKCKMSKACPKWGCDGATFKAYCFYNGDSSYTNAQGWGTTEGTEPTNSKLKMFTIYGGCTDAPRRKNNSNLTNIFSGTTFI